MTLRDRLSGNLTLKHINLPMRIENAGTST